MFNELQPHYGHHFSTGDTVFVVSHGRFHTSVNGPSTITAVRQGEHGVPVLVCGSSRFFQDTHRNVDNPDVFLLPEGDPALDLVPQIAQVRQIVNQIHHHASTMISNPSDENLGSLIEQARHLIDHGDPETNEADTPIQGDPAQPPSVSESEPGQPEPAPENTRETPSPVDAAPAPRTESTRKPARIRHGLTADGKPHDQNAQVLTTPGAGRGLCTCGQLSEVLPSRKARRQWMIEHKRESDLVTTA